MFSNIDSISDVALLKVLDSINLISLDKARKTHTNIEDIKNRSQVAVKSPINIASLNTISPSNLINSEESRRIQKNPEK